MEYNDTLLLENIVNYCDEISDAIKEYGVDKATFDEKSSLRAMFAFFVLEIGENANKLSKTFLQSHTEIEWKAIIGFRHRIVHAYDSIDAEFLWDAIQKDIPELREYCSKIL